MAGIISIDPAPLICYMAHTMSAKQQTVDKQVALTITPPPDLLLVCVQDPFDGVGDSSNLVHSLVPASNNDTAPPWKLEVVMEMNTPRVFESWATRSCFTLDLSVSAAALPAAGAWGGCVSTLTGDGNCRVLVMRDGDDKVSFSLVNGACHAEEKSMPVPDTQRFLNADIAFELNGKSALSVGAVAAISNNSWSHLIAGSAVATKGMAFDSKWRQNLDAGDGDSTVTGAWAFAVMSADAYQTLCDNRGWLPYIQTA